MSEHQRYLEIIKSFVLPEYLKSAQMTIKINQGGTDSVLIQSAANVYRNSVNNLFCKIKTKGKVHFIAFKNTYQYVFHKMGIAVSSIKSDPDYFRIKLNDFFNEDFLSLHKKELADVMNRMFLDTLNFPAFGCCSRYEQCSDEKKCLHNDQLYSTSCRYRKNMEAGKIFYGKNKNV